MCLKPLTLVFGTAGAYVLYGIVKVIYREFTSPFDIYRGQKRYVQEYGRTWKFHRFFGQTALLTTDPKAIHHFLSNSQIYQKSEAQRFSLGRVAGPGILVVEGNVHKQQRKGFNYKIDALSATDDAEPNELAEAFEAVFAAETEFSIVHFLQLRLPGFAALYQPEAAKQDKIHCVQGPPRLSLSRKALNAVIVIEAQATMMRIRRRLLAESKREISENGPFPTGRARDLITLLVRANTSKDLPANQRLTDDDDIMLLDDYVEVSTFLVAGQETTSTAVTWALFALTQNPTAQARLREELLSISTDHPTMDELNALPYLDCVAHETLRMYAPAPATSRTAFRDDVVPLGTPVTDTRGKAVHESLRVKVFNPHPRAELRRRNLGTGSGGVCRPERWEVPPPGASAVPGVWGHMLTFLGGPRSCIGFRFSLIEMKALIFTLVHGLEFEIAVPVAEMGKNGHDIVQRPLVVIDRGAGNRRGVIDS
ncbi:cytochrome P450 [Mycena leptocephala]|nr:cytochrome P450 [Mycena leptocephala]